MSEINLQNIKKIHFIGIGGIGMSALARLFLQAGKEVSGSDRDLSQITEALANEGVTIFTSQVAGNIAADIDLVIYTEAMAKSQEEMQAAESLGVPMVNYFSALGLVANPYYLIAVAGTHGKTTTTAMLADVLEEAGLDPSVVVGSLRTKTQSNYRAGKSKYFVVEACEYKRDFLSLEPDILLITNVELDHVDYYKDLSDVQDAFQTLAKQVPADGFIIADTSHPNIKPILEGVEATVIDYRPEINLGLKLHQPGLHNKLNAGAVGAVAKVLGIKKDISHQALEKFAGTWRRFEYKGTFIGDGGAIPVYDDYAHHPTEILATIGGVRELYGDRQLTIVFQSHTYTRTAELFPEFVIALAKANRVIILPIYAAREENVSGVSSEKLATAINKEGTEALAIETVEAVIALIKNETQTGGIVVTMGAGDMTSRVATGLVS